MVIEDFFASKSELIMCGNADMRKRAVKKPKRKTHPSFCPRPTQLKWTLAQIRLLNIPFDALSVFTSFIFTLISKPLIETHFLVCLWRNFIMRWWWWRRTKFRKQLSAFRKPCTRYFQGSYCHFIERKVLFYAFEVTFHHTHPTKLPSRMNGYLGLYWWEINCFFEQWWWAHKTNTVH
jgi:hypothetical protein